MKKTIYFLLILIFAGYSCSDDDSFPDKPEVVNLNNTSSGNVVDNNLAPGQMRFTFTSQVRDTTLTLQMRGLGQVKVDWGDGTKPEQIYLDKIKDLYETQSHSYKPNKTYTITVSDLDEGNVEAILFYDQSKVLYFGDNNKLNIIHISSGGSDIEQLDITKCQALSGLTVYSDKMKYLNFNANKNLEELGVYGNVDSLVISELDNLKKLSLDINTFDFQSIKNISLDEFNAFLRKTEVIDLSNLKIRKFSISNTPNLKSLIVHSASRLNDLSVSNDNLNTVSLKNLPELTKLYLVFNSLDKLDLANEAPKLESVNLSYDGYLGELNLGEKLTYIAIRGNSSENPLQKDLKKLDLKKCANLTGIYFSFLSSLEDLDIDGLTKIEGIDISKTLIQSLDLSANKDLARLSISSSELKALNITSLEKLEYAILDNNKLEELKTTGLQNISFIHVRNNRLAESTIINLYNVLDKTFASDGYKKSIRISGNPGNTPNVRQLINSSDYWEVGDIDDNVTFG